MAEKSFTDTVHDLDWVIATSRDKATRDEAERIKATLNAALNAFVQCMHDADRVTAETVREQSANESRGKA